MSRWTGHLIRFGDMAIQTDMGVYGPDDDTFLLEDSVALEGTESVIEIGSGTGFTAVSAALKGCTVTATDVNPLAVELTRHNAALNGVDIEAVEGDLFCGLDRRFDVVLFNPPYLPTDEEDRLPGPIDAAFSGGPGGDRVILRFLDACPDHLTDGGRVYLILSSLTKKDEVGKKLRAGWENVVAGTSDAGMEGLEVLRLRRTVTP